MKLKRKNNLRQLLTAALLLSMLLSIFAPTIMAAPGKFSVEVTEDTEKKELNYVSIGDSMTNGYGFVGYEQDSADLNVYNPMAKDHKNSECGNDFGLNMYGAGAYPLQFEQYLENELGYTVNHTKLATSAMLPEDFLYLLGGRDSEIDDNYGGYRHYIGSYSYGRPAEFEKQVVDFRAHVQKSVTEADVITLDLGNASFGAFFMDKITKALGVLGWSLDEADKKLTLEYALSELDEADRDEIVAFVDSFMSNLDIDAVLAEYGFSKEKTTDALNVVEYTFASFIINYRLVVEQILKMNPDVEIVFVGLLNTTYGMELAVDDDPKNNIRLGDMMDDIFDALNNYIELVPLFIEADKIAPEASFYYAEQPEPKLIFQILDELYDNNWVLENDNRLSGATVRKRNIDAYNNDLCPLFSSGFGISLPKITLADVEVFEATNPDWTYAAYGYGFTGQGNDLKSLSIALYLGVEKAIVECADFDAITLNGLKMMTDGSGLIGIFEGVSIDVGPNSTPADVAEQIYAALTRNDDIRGLCKFYAMFKVGNGISLHPTPAGHDEIVKSVIAAYEGNGIEYDAETLAGRDIIYYLQANGYMTLGEMLSVFVGFTSFDIETLYDDVMAQIADPAEKVRVIKKVYAILSAYGLLDDNGSFALIEKLATALDKYTTDEQDFELIDYLYNKAFSGEELDKLELFDRVYHIVIENGNLTDNEKVSLIGEIYFILKAEGVLAGYASMLAIVEDLMVFLGGYTTYEQQFALVDYIYGLVIDNALENVDKMAVVDYIYNVVLIDTEISATEKLEVIAGVYAILADEYFGEYSLVFGTIANIYVKLADAGLITAEEGFNIVNFVYARIIDGTVSDQDIYEIATYIYKTLFFEMVVTPAALLDEHENYTKALSVEDKIAIIDIIFGELENTELIEASQNLDPIIDIYIELKADENISDLAIVAIFDITFETIEEKTVTGEEIITEALIAEVGDKITTTDVLDDIAKKTIISKFEKVLPDYGNSETPTPEEPTPEEPTPEEPTPDDSNTNAPTEPEVDETVLEESNPKEETVWDMIANFFKGILDFFMNLLGIPVDEE